MRSLKLYVATSDGPTKIGVSQNPQKRMTTLERRDRNPVLVHVERVPPDLNAYDVERLAHGLLANLRHGSFDKEWFNITAEQGIAVVRRAMEMAQTEDCLIGWSIRIKINPKTKGSLEQMADADEIDVEGLIGSILHKFITSRSST